MYNILKKPTLYQMYANMNSNVFILFLVSYTINRGLIFFQTISVFGMSLIKLSLYCILLYLHWVYGTHSNTGQHKPHSSLFKFIFSLTFSPFISLFLIATNKSESIQVSRSRCTVTSFQHSILNIALHSFWRLLGQNITSSKSTIDKCRKE